MEEDWTKTDPPEHHIDVREIAHTSTSGSDEDEDGSDTPISNQAPGLAFTSDVVFKNDGTMDDPGLPLTVCDLQFRSGASHMTEFREGMTWLCLLSSTDAKAGHIGTSSMKLGGQSLDHWCGVIWNPGIVGQQDICVCYDCLCLIVWFRDMMLLVHVWTSRPAWTGMMPGNCRTITWELGLLRRLITPCDMDCLGAQMNQQFKGVQGHVLVRMTNRVENNRLKRCAGGCRSALGHCPVVWAVWLWACFGRLL